MIAESVRGMNVNKLTRKGSDSQVQSVSFFDRELMKLRPKICVFPVTSKKKDRVGRSLLIYFIFFLIFISYFP